MGQASQASTVTVQNLPRSDAIPAIVIPLAVPSASGDFFDTFFLMIPALMFSHLSDDGNGQKVITTSQSASTITQVLSTASQIPQSVPNIGATLQTGGKPTSSPTPDPGSLSSSAVTPVSQSVTIHEEFHSSIESKLVQRDNIHQPLGSLSSSPTTARDNISPQITSVVDAHATMTSGPSALSTQSNTRDMAHSISTEVSARETLSVPSTPNIVEHTSAPHGHLDG
jgi:ribosome-associated translation inhibitor RaiA